MTGKRQIYLDYNASAPLLPAARDAMMAALDADANPSSVHAQGRQARSIVQKARRQVAALFNAKPDHVVFTSGATEAAAQLLTPHYSMGRSPLKMSHLYVCASDHPCVLAGGQFAKDAVTVLPVDENGLLERNALGAALKAHDKSKGLALVAIHHANNETGVIQPVDEIAEIVSGAGGMLVIDAVQTAGRVPIDIHSGSGDFLIVSSHKLGGPKGAGAIIAKSDLVMPMPLIPGGGQERGHRGGTEAPHNLAGFGAAAEYAQLKLEDFPKLGTLRDRLEAGILAVSPDIIIHGSTVERLANTVFFTVPGMKAETLQIALDLKGFAVSAGSACSSGKVGQSHVLTAMGMKSGEGAIRVSFGLATTDAEIAAFLSAFQQVVGRKAA